MLVLGSGSPRRREILHFFSIPFQVETPSFDECQVSYRGDPAAFVQEVAKKKALCLSKRFPDQIILTADTVVVLDGRLFLKPQTHEEAFLMLKELSGKQHSVHTGACVLRNELVETASEESLVEFHPLSDEQIHSYHRGFDPLDKAGAYAIQRSGSIIVKRIEGCYYNIMGLPLNTTRRLLVNFGIDLWDFLV